MLVFGQSNQSFLQGYCGTNVSELTAVSKLASKNGIHITVRKVR